MKDLKDPPNFTALLKTDFRDEFSNSIRPNMTDYAGPRDYVENFQSSWMTLNILGTLLTVTQPHCKSDDSARIVLAPE